MIIPKSKLIVAGALLCATLVAVIWFAFARVKWETYVSPQYGYSVQYPKGWMLDVSQKEAPVDRIISLDGVFVLHIGILNDPRTVTEDGFAGFIADIQSGLEAAKDINLVAFESTFHEKEYIRGDYAQGAVFTGSDGVVYEQSEVGIVLSDGTIYILTTNVDLRMADKYAKFVKEIPFRFVPKEYKFNNSS